jgi:hypothetical protein
LHSRHPSSGKPPPAHDTLTVFPGSTGRAPRVRRAQHGPASEYVKSLVAEDPDNDNIYRFRDEAYMFKDSADGGWHAH